MCGLFDHLPEIDECCGCVPDLKTATAIIAVFGIITSPAVSWSVVRHSYVVRVSCFASTNAGRPDVVDINLNNVLSFGFGANAGLGASCFTNIKQVTKNETKALIRNTRDTVIRTNVNAGKEKSTFIDFVIYLGWIVLAADIAFLICCVYLLVKLFQGSVQKACLAFIISAAIAIVLSFSYGMLYVGACLSIGGSFPIFEFIFTIVDLIVWTYFLMVVHAFRRSN